MPDDLGSPGPLLVAHLLEPLDALLVDLLRTLADDEWEAPTIAPGWTVRNVVAHLLDTSLRRLASCRDGRHLPVARHDPCRDLVGFINRMNADGVRFFSGLPTRPLVEVVAAAGRANAHYLESLDPMAPSAFGVSWAGEASSPNWFDIARELTERWHHQQQIRLAVQRPGAMAEFHHAVLECFMRALPHWYRTVGAPDGSLIEIEVEGDGGGSWHLFRDGNAWRLVSTAGGTRLAHTTMPADIAWRVFTKGIGRADALARSTIRGDRALGEHVLLMTAIVG